MLVLFNFITNKGLSPNEMYLIQSIYNKRVPKLDNLHLEIRKLEAGGYMKDNKLTIKGIQLVEDYETAFKMQETGKVTRKVKFTEEQIELVKKYREIFPKGTLPSGSPSRSSMKELEKKFMWFLLNYEYSWDTILKATEKYVAEFASSGYKYMKTSSYFIAKTEGNTTHSLLASYCDMIEDGDDIVTSNYMTHKVL